MASLFGNTTADAPTLIDGTGCAATMLQDDGDGTVFSMFLYLSGLLGGYADASEGCRDEILAEVSSVIGPEVPDETACAATARTSATCSLFQSTETVLASLVALVDSGQLLVNSLETPTITDGRQAHQELTSLLGQIEESAHAVNSHASDQRFWNALLTSVTSAQESAEQLGELRDTLVGIRDSLIGDDSVQSQQELIASMLCTLIEDGDVTDPRKAEAIRAQLDDWKCDGTRQAVADRPTKGTSVSRLGTIAAAIDSAASAVDIGSPTSPISKLAAALTSLHTTISATLDSITDQSSLQPGLELERFIGEAIAASEIVGQKLDTAQAEHDALAADIQDAFHTAATDTERAVTEDSEDRIAKLNARRTLTHDELSTSYQALIDGLRSSAASSLVNGRDLVDDRKVRLDASMERATQALDERTTSALESIELSTSRSVRDIEAASALLTDSLNKVLLDLGDPTVRGSGVLGAMSSSAALSDTADYQLAQASQHASGYANVREQDVASILLRIAQFRSALEKTASLPAFKLDVPEGTTSQTIYSFALAGGKSGKK